MNISSSLLLILLAFHIFPLSGLATRKLEGSEIDEGREPSLMDLQAMSFVEGDHVQRKELHEVHSGPNPISNSIPQQKWRTKSGRSP